MKRILLAFILVVLFIGASKSQDVPIDYTLTNDTVLVAGLSGSDTLIMKRLRAPHGVLIDLDYSSFGSTSDTVILGQSVDGVHWQAVGYGVVDLSTSGGNYYNDKTASKGYMLELENNTAQYISIYYKNNASVNDTLIVRYGK